MNEFGNLVENTLSSSEIQEMCQFDYDASFDECHEKSVLIAQIINYCILFKNNDGIIEYIHSDNKKEFIINRIASIMNISKGDIQSRIGEIEKYAYLNFYINGYIFHSTNSLYGDELIKNGFVKKEDNEEKNDILVMNQLFSKYDKVNPFQFVINDFNHDYTGIFCNSDPLQIMNYSNGPEWFRLFCGEASVYHQLVNYHKEKGYSTKNYNDALECVNSLIKYYDLSKNEGNEVLSFFNKYWNKFKDTKPMVIAIPTKRVFDEMTMQKAMLNCIYNNPHDYIFDIIVSGKSLLYNNFCVNESIDTKDLNYFSLEQLVVNKTKQDDNEIKIGR